MAVVNPPSALRTPPKLKGDPLLRSYFEQIEFILFQLANRTGGQNDLIYEGGQSLDAILLRLDLIEDRLDLTEADIADLYALIAALDVRVTYLEGLTVVTAVDYTIDGTTAGHQTIVCTAEITVSLDPTPSDRDTATIKVGQKNTQVIINGNGKLIEEDSTMTLRRRQTKRQIGMDLEYSAELDKWFTT
jgi:hypothetical protein